MDLTEVHGQGPRKSLLRRVSFASHTQVKLFYKQSPQHSPEHPDPEHQPAGFVSRADHDENAIPGPSQPQRRVSFRRRSSGVYSEFGERSMDMDLDDTAPLPQHFMPQNRTLAQGSAVEDDDFTEDEDDSSDMEVTEAIARNIERKRSLSLGGNGAASGNRGRRRSSIVTSTQHLSENQPPRHEHPIPEEDASFEHEGEEEPTTSSAHTTSSFTSEGSSGEPMEFTIPILPSMRQPPEPDPLWLQLRAMTHAGSEPYEPPPPESDDDALMIQPAPGHHVYGQQSYDRPSDDEDDDVEQDMDLTSAMTRLQQARASLGLGAPTLRQEHDDYQREDQQPEQDQGVGYQDDTFSTEDSFGDESADLDNRTINLTQRTSLGTIDSSMDETDVQDRMFRIPTTAGEAGQPSPNPQSQERVSAPQPSVEGQSSSRSLSSSVFSAPMPGPLGASGVFSAPAPGALTSSVFTPPVVSNVFAPQTTPGVSPAPPSETSFAGIFSAPAAGGATAPRQAAHPPRSPSKSPGPATIPKPFTFSLPRAGSPSKIPVPTANTQAGQPHRGTAAFAPPTVPKSPKRPAADLPSAGTDGPSASKRPTTGRAATDHASSLPALGSNAPSAEPSATEAAASQPTAGANANRRSSMVRRPAGYFAQRKSLGAGALPSAQQVGGDAGSTGAALRPRASMGAQPSSAALAAPLSRTRSDPGPTNTTGAEKEGSALYPDLTQLASEVQAQRAASPAPAFSKGKEREGEQEAREAASIASPVRASPSPLTQEGASSLPAQRNASPIPTPAPLRDRPSTHIEKPASSQPRIIDVSMAMDVEQDMSIADGPAGASQAWKESVPEEAAQDDDGVSLHHILNATEPLTNVLRSPPFRSNSSSR